MRHVLFFVGPADEDGFVGFNKQEVHEGVLDSYAVGLFSVLKDGSAFQSARSLTAETKGTVWFRAL